MESPSKTVIYSFLKDTSQSDLLTDVSHWQEMKYFFLYLSLKVLLHLLKSKAIRKQQVLHFLSAMLIKVKSYFST